MNREEQCLREMRAAYSILVGKVEGEKNPCEGTGVGDSMI